MASPGSAAVVRLLIQQIERLLLDQPQPAGHVGQVRTHLSGPLLPVSRGRRSLQLSKDFVHVLTVYAGRERCKRTVT